MGTESNPGQSRPAQVYPWAPGFYLWASVSLWISTGPFLLPPPPPLTVRVRPQVYKQQRDFS